MKEQIIGGYTPRWGNCRVTYYSGDRSIMTDFHSHKYYEVSLIVSGRIRSLLCDRCEEGDHSRLVLTAPGTPHYIYMTEPSHYHRVNLCFAIDFVSDYVPEWQELSSVFGSNGNIIPLDSEKCQFLLDKLNAINAEDNSFRQRLLILEFLSHVSDLDTARHDTVHERPPKYVVDALSYIQEHYAEHIVAADLAWKLGISRTTLMTAFKRHTNATLSDYITGVRVKKAVAMLKLGESQESAAEHTGLCNGGGLIRAFKRCYGMTPRQYLKSLEENPPL